MRHLWSAACAMLLAVAPVGAAAQDYPNKPIRVVLPFGPGGGTDVAARILLGKMTERLGWNFVVENRPGGSGFIAATNVARSPADGYALFFAHVGEFAINPALFKSLPYDLDRDFVPITLVCDAPMAFVVGPNSPYATLQDVIAAARAKPGAISYASAGNGSLNHLAAEWLAQSAGVQFLHVPYKGGAPAAAAVAAGEVPFGVSSIPPLAGFIKAGRVKVLGVTTAKRSVHAPDWPTPKELGLGDVDANLWFGLLAPKGTPAAIIERLDAEVRQTLQLPDVKAKFADAGFATVGLPAAEFLAYIRNDAARIRKVIEAGGIKAD